MVTREQAIAAGRRGYGEFHHATEKNRDGTPVRCRVNGKCKTWKRDATAYRLPVKYGLRDCFYITERNATEWEPSPFLVKWARMDSLMLLCGMAFNTPLGILADKLNDLGHYEDEQWVREQRSH